MKSNEKIELLEIPFIDEGDEKTDWCNICGGCGMCGKGIDHNVGYVAYIASVTHK